MDDCVQYRKRPHILIKLISFLFILFILDFGIGKLLRHFYFEQESGILFRTTYAIDSTEADILIFGSSTANHHYVPELFKEKFQMSSYNTGRDGNNILFSYAMLQSILKRHIPKMIIMDINDQEFMKGQDSYDRITSLLPYYDKHPEIQSIVQLKSPYEKYKLFSKIYPFNSLLFTIGVGNADFNKDRNIVNDQEGYIPLKYTWRDSLTVDTSFNNYKLDTTKINIFKSFLEECYTQKIHLFVFTSPKFIRYKYPDLTIESIKRITREFNIPFYSFINDSFFLNHRELFYNPGHLNGKGAEVFTKMVIDKIGHP